MAERLMALASKAREGLNNPPWVQIPLAPLSPGLKDWVAGREAEGAGLLNR